MAQLDAAHAPKIFCHVVNFLYDEEMDVLEEDPILAW